MKRFYWRSLGLGVLAGLPLLVSAATRVSTTGKSTQRFDRSSYELEKEYQNDERIWELARLLLKSTGNSNSLGQLDQAWERLRTPQQWATLRKDGWPEINQYDARSLAIAAECQSMNADFETVFRKICASEPSVADLFTGLALWTQQHGRPRIQNDEHFALHFIYGGGTEATLGKGFAAAVAKEQFDSAPGGSFNLDQMAAAIAGAEWVHQAQLDPDWMQQWVSGRKNFARNLPRFQYGTGDYSPALFDRIHRDIINAYAR